MTCAGDSPASSRIAIAEHVAHAAGHQRDEPRQRLALRAQLEERARRLRRGRAPTSASTSAQTWRSAEAAAAPSTSSTPMRRALAVLERELLELAQQPLLALADLRDERLRRRAVELDAEPVALARRPTSAAPAA